MNSNPRTKLHRLIWSPDDIGDDGQLLTSAFPRRDLEGGDRYLSVDRSDILTLEAIRSVALEQNERANGETTFRETPHSALLDWANVLELRDDKGVKPFTVTDEPLPNNPAHCGLRNQTGSKGKGYVNQLRILLVDAVEKICELEDLNDHID